MFEFHANNWIPKFILADPNGKAMAKAIEAAMNYMNGKVADAVACFGDVDTMPKWRLNELAWEYNLQLYQHVGAQRALVKNANRDSKIYGTKAAIVNAVGYRFHSGTTVLEWHEYDGEPYHFKVQIVATEDDQEEAEAIIAQAKNARSYCDGVEMVEPGIEIIEGPTPLPEYS